MKQDKNEIITCPKCGHDRVQSGLVRGQHTKGGRLVQDGTEEYMLQCVQCHYVFPMAEALVGGEDTQELIE